MPSPYKSDHERASRSLAALKPKLSRRPISVSPSGRHHDSHGHSSGSGADQLKQILQQHDPSLRMEFGDSTYPRPPPSVSRPLPTPEEAVGIIQHQSAYIRQLESELKLSQGELTTYKVHLNEVLDENARMVSAQQTSAIIQNVLGKTQTDGAKSQPATKESLSKHMNDLELLKSLHSSKAEILEQQLASTKQALYAAEQRAEELRSRLLIQESMSDYDRDGTRKSAGLCIKCGQRAGLIAAAQYDQSANIQQLSQEKEELIETLANIKRQLTEMQDRELQAVQKVKVGIEITEQANIEKTKALLQREQMHEELSLLKQRFESLINEHKSTLHETKSSARVEVKNELGELEKRLRHATDAEGSLKAQLERTAREKADVASELTQTKTELSIYQSSMVESTTGRRIDMTQLACERDMAVEERNKLKNRLVKVEQIKDEAVLRVKRELEDVRLRLDKAERELILSGEEGIRLTRQNQNLEKQLNNVKMAYNSIDRSRNDELQSLTRKLEAREEELQRIITDTESRYSKQLNELEMMYVAQNQLVEQLRAECGVQADTIQQLSSKYRNENKQLRHDNETFSRQLSKCRERIKAMDIHEVEHGKVHKKLRGKVAQLDEENRDLARQSNELVVKSSEYKREVEILAGEVKFLKCQHCGDSSADPEKRMSNSVVDDLLDALKSEMVSQDANITGSIDILRNVSGHSDH